MAIQVADNFQYLGQKPLDARVKYATVADMAAVAASSLYDGIMAYVVATEKNYQWKSTNEVDQTLGKWREFQSGGGGDTTGKAKSEAIAPVFDDTETYAEGDRVMYEDELYVFNTAHTGAWDAADADKSDVDSEIPNKLTSQQMQAIKDAFVIDTPRTGYPIMFDETGAEHVVAWYRYANGTKKPVYQKTFVGEITSTSTSRAWFTVAENLISTLHVDKLFVDFNASYFKSNADNQLVPFTYSDTGGNISIVYSFANNNGVLTFVKSVFGAGTYVITVKYTKTTDTPQ